MNSTLADHKVEDLLEKISGMDMYNLQEVNSELDEILTPFSLLPPLDYDVRNNINTFLLYNDNPRQ